MAIKNQELFASRGHATRARCRARGGRAGRVIERVCVIGAGVDRQPLRGSPRPGGRRQRADAQRREHADALNRDGLRITGRSDLHADVVAAADPGELAPFDLGIVATKAAGLEEAAAALEGRFPGALVMTTLNGLGAEEVVRAHGDWPIVSAVTFMSGTKHSDTRGRVRPRHGDVARPVRGHAVRAGRGDRRPRPALRAQGRGVPGSASRAVVEADLQRDGQLRRRAHRAPPRPPLRRRGRSRPTSVTSSTPSSTRARRSPPRRASSSTTTRGR